VELMDREKECNLCHVYCKAKGWFQKSQDFFKQFRKKVKMERKRENGLMQEDLKLKCFSPL
jgi:hypothetical protein